jgi:hypothetical protein
MFLHYGQESSAESSVGVRSSRATSVRSAAMGEAVSSLNAPSRFDFTGGWHRLNVTPLTGAEIDELCVMPDVAELLRGYRAEVVGGIVKIMPGPSQEHGGAATVIYNAVFSFFSFGPVPARLDYRRDGEVRIDPITRIVMGLAAAERPRVVVEVNMRVPHATLMDLLFTAPQVQMVLLGHFHNGSRQFEVWQRGADGVPGRGPRRPCASSVGLCVLCMVSWGRWRGSVSTWRTSPRRRSSQPPSPRRLACRRTSRWICGRCSRFSRRQRPTRCTIPTAAVDVQYTPVPFATYPPLPLPY